MDKYISQLIKDIEQLIIKKPSTISDIWDGSDLKRKAEVDDMSYVEEYLYGEQHELQYIVGVKKELLPPSERLNELQITKLLPLLEALLENHNFELSYPTKLDNRTKYELLYKEWSNKHPKVNYGSVGIEFCGYNEEECPLPGKCNACEESRIEYEKFDKEEKKTESISDGLLPIKGELESSLMEQKADKVKDTIENLKPAEGNIAGIFNYCNRWCERCKFTDRCTNYQFEKELGFYDRNTDKEKMVEDLGAILSGTLSFLKSKMDGLDIDISQYAEVENVDRNPARHHILAEQSRKYMKQMSKWLEGNFDYFSEIASNLFNVSRKSFNELNYHLETIGWHMTMIPVKIVRALNPKKEFHDDEFYETDSNTTAKLVLECIDESIVSLSFLHQKLSKKGDNILDFLAMLSQIKAGLEKEFPRAKEFVRPGLDE